MSKPWHLAGPLSGASSPGLEDALRRLHTSENRAPTSEDAPAPSTFPATPASRAAIRYARQFDKPVVTKRRRHELTHGKDTG